MSVPNEKSSNTPAFQLEAPKSWFTWLGWVAITSVIFQFAKVSGNWVIWLFYLISWFMLSADFTNKLIHLAVTRVSANRFKLRVTLIVFLTIVSFVLMQFVIDKVVVLMAAIPLEVVEPAESGLIELKPVEGDTGRAVEPQR